MENAAFWQIKHLPQKFQCQDKEKYNTPCDVILHSSFTAESGNVNEQMKCRGDLLPHADETSKGEKVLIMFS